MNVILPKNKSNYKNILVFTKPIKYANSRIAYAWGDDPPISLTVSLLTLTRYKKIPNRKLHI